MLRRLKLLVGGILVLGSAAALIAACSQRESLKDGPEVQREAPAASGVVVSTGERVTSQADPGRTACRPAGALGPANPTTPGPFQATFTATTDAPLSACGASDWDVQIHSRSPETWYALDSMAAQHGPDCGSPPATHELHGDHAAAIFLCRDHLMTALRGDAYAAIYFTPNQLVDLSHGSVSIRFDLSTERMSIRDWVDLWLTPWEENMALPLEDAVPDLQGPPRNSVQVTLNSGENSPLLSTTRDGVQRNYHKGWEVDGIETGVAPETNQAAVRQTFQLTVGQGRARFERFASPTAPALTFWDEEIDFPFQSAVLQFGHHSYSPTKDEAGVPATWHWDNIGISRAIPFHISRSTERFADSEFSPITFKESANDNSWLRFSAIGTPEVSFDNGASWQTATRQDGLGQVGSGKRYPEHFSSYFMKMPAGTSSVRVRFGPDDWYSGPYFAQGFAIWSR